MRLDLSSLDLIVSGPTGPGVAGALTVRTEQGDPTAIPDFAMGFGMPVPANVKSTFAALSRLDAADPFTIEDGGTWMHTDPARTDQRWFVQWRDETAVICGETSAGGVNADGLTFRNARLRVVLRSGPTAASIVRIWIEGDVEFASDLGPLKLRNVAGRFTLAVNAEGLPNLQNVLENPASVLDGAFTGTLTVSLTAAQIGLLNSVDFRNAEINLSAQASSAAGARRLRLDAATLKLGGRLLFAGAELAQSQLEARLGGWPTAANTPIELNGQGTLTMPASVSTKIGGAGIAATLQLRCSASTTRFEFAAAGVRLDPSFNVLNLSSVGLRVLLTNDIATNRWTFAAAGTVEQSWSNLARKLLTARLVDLGPTNSFPDVRATLSVAAQSLPTVTGQQASLRLGLALELVQQGRPYEGPLGDFPVRVSAPRFSLAADIGAGGFSNVTVQAEGRLSITGELKAILPWQNLRLGAEFISGQPPQPPTLRLLVTGMPAFALPPLKRGGQPLSLLRIDRAEFELGATLRFGGKVSILPGLTWNELITRLGVPSRFAEFLRPVGELLVGINGTWDLTYNVSDGSGSMAISLEKEHPPELDVFKALRSLFPGVADSDSFALDDFTFLKIEPGSIQFVITFGGAEEALVQLSAGVSCTVLDATFDARCTLRMRGARPELELVAGLENPILISFPGIDALGDNLTQTLLNQLKRTYTLNPTDEQFLTDAIQNIRNFFAQPGMDTAAQFELRQLRLVLRPTDTVAPVEVSGTLRPVRLPNFVSKVLPVIPSVTLGATARSVFLELRVDGDNTSVPKPLVSVPLGGRHPVDFILRGFKVAYAWDSNSVDLGLEVNINTADVQLFSRQIGTGVLLPAATANAPSVASAFAIKTIASVPPIPVPEWNVTFGDVGNANNRGIEFIIGIPDQRFLTLNLRKTAFSITRTLFGPGADFDGGFLFGNPPANENDVSQFYLRGSCIEGVFITYPAPLVPFLNPFGGIFMPPFPLGPSTYGDIFFKELSLGFNLPGLLYARITLEKPLPEISLLTIVELIFLASKGFTLPLPQSSSLRKVFFVALRGNLKLLLPPALFGTESSGRPKMVELMDINAEFNAADVLGTIGQGLSAGKQIVESAGQGLDLIKNNPNMLIRLIPRDKRSFRFDQSLNLPGLKVQLNASVFLLTPEELKEELVLFHESRRPFGKGSGRVRLGTTPPTTGPVVSQDPRKTMAQTASWVGLANAKESFNANGVAFVKYVDDKRRAAEEDARKRTQAVLNQTLKPRIRTALRDLFFSGSGPIWSLLINKNDAGLRSELEQRGLAFAVDIVAKAIRDVRTMQSAADIQRFQQRLVDQIADAAPLSTPEPLDLGEDRRTIAATLAAQIVIDTPAQSGGVAGIKVAAPASRLLLLQTRFNKTEHQSVVRALGAVGNKAEEKLRTAPPKTKAEERVFRANVEQEVLKTLNERAVKPKVLDLARIDGNVFGTTKVTNAILAAFPNHRQMKSVSTAVTIFDVNRSIGLAVQLGSSTSPPVPPEDRLREVVGQQVIPRPDGPHAAVPFAVDVPGPNVTFRVEFRQGKFILVILDSRGNEIKTRDLPAAIVGSSTPAPGVAGALTRLFVLAPKIVERAMTAAEKLARADNPQESSAALYQQSLFARPEYAIPGTEGRRGNLTLADILRSNGTYVIPSGPVLIAGGQIKLFSSGSVHQELSVIGLLAPPVATGSSGVFFYGHQVVTLPLPSDYELRLEGDFHIVAGNMWPSTLADASIERNSVSFSGVARLRRNRREVANSSASGFFKYPEPGRDTEFALKMRLRVGDSWEFGFTDESLMKASFAVAGDLNITFEGSLLSMSFSARADLTWQVAEFEMDEIDLPSVTVCVINPLDPFGLLEDVPDTICGTVGGGSIPVPTGRLVLGPEQTKSASVSASLGGDGAISVKVRVQNDARFSYDFVL